MPDKITQQIDELSKNLLSRYAVKASKSKGEHIAKMTSKLGRANGMKGESEVRVALHKSAAKDSRKVMNRHNGIKKAVQKIGEEVIAEELKKVGTYTNKSGAKLTMHRNSDDPSHHMLVHNGKVVDGHTGPAKEFHAKLIKDGFSGTLHEEVEINELSRNTIKSYMVKSDASKKHHQDKAIKADDMQLDHSTNASPAEAKAAGKARKIMRFHDHAALKREKGRDMAADKLSRRVPKKDGVMHEEVEPLTEWKTPKHSPDEIEKSKKHMMKHKEADAIGQSMHTATRHFNYVQDACDHVYSNHLKDVSYEDYDKMKPHLIDHFKAHGLK